jgi:cytochrome c oxidase subunit 2
MLNWFPENVSTFGSDIDSLFSLIYYITGVAFVLTEGALLLLLFLYRRRDGRRATYVTGNRLDELGWLLVP